MAIRKRIKVELVIRHGRTVSQTLSLRAPPSCSIRTTLESSSFNTHFPMIMQSTTSFTLSGSS